MVVSATLCMSAHWCDHKCWRTMAPLTKWWKCIFHTLPTVHHNQIHKEEQANEQKYRELFFQGRVWVKHHTGNNVDIHPSFLMSHSISHVSYNSIGVRVKSSRLIISDWKNKQTIVYLKIYVCILLFHLMPAVSLETLNPGPLQGFFLPLIFTPPPHLCHPPQSRTPFTQLLFFYYLPPHHHIPLSS